MESKQKNQAPPHKKGDAGDMSARRCWGGGLTGALAAWRGGRRGLPLQLPPAADRASPRLRNHLHPNPPYRMLTADYSSQAPLAAAPRQPGVLGAAAGGVPAGARHRRGAAHQAQHGPSQRNAGGGAAGRGGPGEGVGGGARVKSVGADCGVWGQARDGVALRMGGMAAPCVRHLQLAAGVARPLPLLPL